MIVNCLRTSLLAVVLTVALAASVSAQVFGTFSWQMQPYCNIVTMTITQIPTGFTLDGVDDQCAALKRASLVGMATLNPDGTVGVTFTIVTAPAGKGVHVSAVVSPVTGSGTWTDSVANSGTFVLAGAVPLLPPRPLPTSGIGASVITTTEIAPGAVGGTDINGAEVQARVTGTCPAGQAMSGVNADGTVICVATDVGTQFRAVGHPVAAAPSGASTAVAFSTVSYNLGGGAYNSGTGVYAVPQTGLYLITAAIRWLSFTSGTGAKCILIQRNGTPSGTTICDAPSTTTSHQVQNASAVMSLTAGDAIRIMGYQETGAAGSLSGHGADTHFTVTKLR